MRRGRRRRASAHRRRERRPHRGTRALLPHARDVCRRRSSDSPPRRDARRFRGDMISGALPADSTDHRVDTRTREASIPSALFQTTAYARRRRRRAGGGSSHRARAAAGIHGSPLMRSARSGRALRSRAARRRDRHPTSGTARADASTARARTARSARVASPPIARARPALPSRSRSGAACTLRTR